MLSMSSFQTDAGLSANSENSSNVENNFSEPKSGNNESLLPTSSHEDEYQIPDSVLKRIITNLPLFEQFVSVHIVCEGFRRNSPAERRLKSVYIENHFVHARYSKLIAHCGGNRLQKLFFDPNTAVITGSILIPFLDNCPNINSIMATKFSDDAAVLLPRFSNLQNIKIEYCTASVRKAFSSMRLVKIIATHFNDHRTRTSLRKLLSDLVADPNRLQVLIGIDFTNIPSHEYNSVFQYLFQSFPNLRAVRFAQIDAERIVAAATLPCVRRFLHQAERSVGYLLANYGLEGPSQFSGMDVPNLKSFRLTERIAEVLGIDWTRSLISTLPCCQNLRRFSIDLINANSDFIDRILFAVSTEMPALRILKIDINGAYNGDRLSTAHSVVNLKHLRRLTIVGGNWRNAFVGIDKFINLLIFSDVHIQHLDTSIETIEVLKLISRLEFITSFRIRIKNSDILRAFFLSVNWPKLERLRLVTDTDPCLIFDQKNVAFFPRLISLDYGMECGKFDIVPLLSNFVLNLPNLRRLRVGAIKNIDDNVVELLAYSTTLRRFEATVDTTNSADRYFRSKGFLLLRQKRRRRIYETGIFSGELIISLQGWSENVDDGGDDNFYVDGPPPFYKITG